MAHELQAEQAVATARFGDRVAEAVERKRSQLLVGLDPQPDLLPVELRGDAHLGRDAVEPFLAACRREGGGIFCVLKTSNAGSGEIQDLVLSDGRPLWHEVARLVREWGEELVGEHGLSSVGAVVGATHPRAVGEARRALPQSILLLPGVGAQGATPADVARAFASGPASALVTASRSVIYAFRVDGADWRGAPGGQAARPRGHGLALARWEGLR